jgi:hypothetical protein
VLDAGSPSPSCGSITAAPLSLCNGLIASGVYSQPATSIVQPYGCTPSALHAPPTLRRGGSCAFERRHPRGAAPARAGETGLPVLRLAGVTSLTVSGEEPGTLAGFIGR